MTEQEMINRAKGIMDFVLQTADRVPNSRNCAKKNSEADHDELNDNDFVSLDED